MTSEGALTVALDITITPELRLEGMGREVIRCIQAQRKNSGLEISDRIKVVVSECEQSAELLAKFGEHIAAQVLATSISAGNAEGGEELNLDTFKLVIKIEKA